MLSRFVYVHTMTFAQRRNRLTTHFSERIPVVKRRISVLTSRHGVTSQKTWIFIKTAVRNPYLLLPAVIRSLLAAKAWVRSRSSPRCIWVRTVQTQVHVWVMKIYCVSYQSTHVSHSSAMRVWFNWHIWGSSTRKHGPTPLRDKMIRPTYPPVDMYR